MADEALGTDYSKWKVNDLKKALKDLGLSTVGNKSDLIERLQGKVDNVTDLKDAVEESVDIDEDEVLGADLDEPSISDGNNESIIDTPPENESKTVASSPTSETTPASQVSSKKITLVRKSLSDIEKENKVSDDNIEIIKDLSKTSSEEKKPSSEKQVIKISTVSVKERLEMRAQKFGVSLSEEAKRAARAERFGTTGGPKSSTTSIGPSVVSSIEVLKKRAERFGCTTASKLVQSELEEKRQQRAKRFKMDAPAV